MTAETSHSADVDTSASCAYEFDPTTVDETSLSTAWSCPHDPHPDGDRCPFHMDPGERADRGISDDEFIDSLVDVLEDGTSGALIGATLPELNLDFEEIERENERPVDFRHAEIESLSVVHTRFEERVDLRHTTVGELQAANCDFEEGVLCAGAHFHGEVDLFEAIFVGDDADFRNATFEGPLSVDQATFEDDLLFDGAEIHGPATFDGAELSGRSIEIGDSASFVDVEFGDHASFHYVSLECTEFVRTTFHGDAVFEGATADGAVSFEETTFEGTANFDEVIFGDDVTFDRVEFTSEATFRGTEFQGGATVLGDDVSFSDVTFGASVTFEHGQFCSVTFADAVFEEDVVFERATFTADATFDGAVFGDEADFDEVLFEGDTTFEGAVFQDDAIFRGAEFHGGTDYLEDDVVFRDATFIGDADFRLVRFNAVNFVDAAFEGSADFTESEVLDLLRLRVSSFGDDTYFNFTEATITEGKIVQPESGWVRFDMTKATIGEVELAAENPDDRRQLLDYYRFCDTTFDGFDFSAHTAYLDRNDWVLHTFDGGTRDYEFALEMTPEVIEKTYLKAKKNASAQSDIKAAGEFRVKRQQYARKKFLSIAQDGSEAPGTRFQNLLRAVENAFLGISCGYGLRLYRIAAVFVTFPLFSAFLFAFGGDAFETGAGQLALSEVLTPAGMETLATNVYFTYITFLTIGYGNIAPIGLGARVLAAVLVYMNVILAGLFLYALIKRSEI